MMKAITVRYFAAYREAVGQAEEELETAAETADQLFDELVSRHPGLQRFPAMKMAVNDELVDGSRLLQDRDVLLLFPPVAGG